MENCEKVENEIQQTVGTIVRHWFALEFGIFLATTLACKGWDWHSTHEPITLFSPTQELEVFLCHRLLIMYSTITLLLKMLNDFW